MRRLVLGAVVLAATTTAALAAVPDFDTQGYCHLEASTDGPLLPDKLRFCLRTEHSALRTLHARWQHVSDADYRRCAYAASVRAPNRPTRDILGRGVPGLDTSRLGSYGTYLTCLGGTAAAGQD